MTIGQGKVHDDLYHLQLQRPIPTALHSFLHTLLPSKSINIAVITKLDEFTLWHYRLEHISMTQSILHEINKDYVQPSAITNLPCDVCPIAKQYKLPKAFVLKSADI